MRKLSSHYCLKPDGNWAKRPVITIDDKGEIIRFVELGDDFKEEPGLEYFPGVIVPSFIGVINAIESDSFEHRNINKMFISGARRFVVGDRSLLKLPSKVKFVNSSEALKSANENPWTLIQEECSWGISLSEAIMHQTMSRAKETKMFPEWGVIALGSIPGLLLLQGVDLKTFSLTHQTKIRVLVD